MLTDAEEFEVATKLAKCAIIVYINCPNHPINDTINVKDYYPKDYEPEVIREMNDLASKFFNFQRTKEVYDATIKLYTLLKEKYNYDDSYDV